MHELGWEWFLLFGLSAGLMAGFITGEHGLGLFGSLIIGIVGAVLGGYLFHITGLPYDSVTVSFIAALAGSVILLVLIKLMRRF